ncbi:exonuclease domain-containing protein [Microbacterium sp. ZXX196]|uniref:exonuclease domain-containing protein n=1 Tax=Microbacterium sp. ZXX196 TaxID=2609291 RepID=UPI0012B9B3E2|nr:exonuclease domain-containing protein [Microbacterium sp. ZXX196]MTE24888.1 DNA polymerase III [Microbacterium sp. ZXX196]
MPYAVLDLETTGFSPKRGDRIVEIGVVLVDDAGEIEHEWGTLVNPQRDVGATHVHGIRASDVVDAPLFGDVATGVTELLDGRTLVAHNQAFDVRFLRAELAGQGHTIDDEFKALCTMLWSRRAFGAAKLADVCSLLEIEIGSAHAALDDARATSRVLAALDRRVGHEAEWRSHVAAGRLGGGAAARPRQQRTPGKARGGQRAAAADPEPPVWKRVSVPAPLADEGAAVYLDLVERVLDDGVISVDEHWRLDAIAEAARIDPADRRRLHADYLAAAVAEAGADGVVTESERAELAQIAAVLDLPVPADPPAAPAARPARIRLEPGSRVVFTGALDRDREEWAYLVAAAGLETGGVTKRTAVVVAADPATQSTKAKKAAAYGVPVVDEQTFLAAFEEFCAR